MMRKENKQKVQKGQKTFFALFVLFAFFFHPPRGPKKDASFVNLLDIRLATDVAQRPAPNPRLAQYLLLHLLTPCNC
jgi:hypothetical protein